MFSYLLTAAPKGEDAYQFFTYRGTRPVYLNYRGKDVTIDNGVRFGVRPSGNGKFIRLIFPGEPNRVLTVDLKTAEKLANGVGRH